MIPVTGTEWCAIQSFGVVSLIRIQIQGAYQAYHLCMYLCLEF